MALHHSRHQVLLGILAPMLLARPIAAAIGARRVGEAGRSVSRFALAATVAAALAIGGARLMAPIEPSGRRDGARLRA